MSAPKIAFIGAGSTVFMKNIVGDCMMQPALAGARFALMDIDAERLAQSETVARKMASSLSVGAVIETTLDRRAALDGADFVVVAFQIGGYRPCTITDFEIPKRFGLRQTIADTLGIGGIMRGLRTVPELWAICSDMMELCPDALMLQYVNPMAINTWAIGAKFPKIKQVGLCHSVQGTAAELAHDLDIPFKSLRYRVAGINHMAFFLRLEEQLKDGTTRDLYPLLKEGFRAGQIPKPNHWNPRCANLIRYEMMTRLGYFVTESSEHFAEYTPYFIKHGREDLIEKFQIPLDEYPKRCEEQMAIWKSQASDMLSAERIDVSNSKEYASILINSVWSGEPSVIYGNLPNRGHIPQLPAGAAIEVPCLIDANGVNGTVVDDLPPHLIALMRTNVNVQELTVAALLHENREHIYHAAMLDPHTAAELDLDQIWQMVDELILAHGDWLPAWTHG